MNASRLLSLSFVAAVALALGSLGGAANTALAEDDAAVGGETVVIEMRIWQHVDDADNIWISARPKGGRWDTLGTIPFPLDHRAGGYSTVSKYRYADLAMGGIGLRVWQPETDRENVFVQACTDSCPGQVPGVRLLWRPLGMIPLALDDGHSSSGRYRYGDLTVAVPRGNPGLLADREHLLALRDVLEGGGADLDWSAGRATADWEGVTVGGTPPRVTGLRLSERGLMGEIWGWLGDLTELTELRLDENKLTGFIPSKLALLANVTDLYLGGNDIEGCIPPPLRRAANHDLDSLGLPDCHAPVVAGSSSGWVVERELTGGSYGVEAEHVGVVVFDVPGNGQIQFDVPVSGVICDLGEPLSSIWDAFDCSHARGFVLGEADGHAWDDFDTWLVVGLRGNELERSHYAGCIYDCGPGGSPVALLEQLAASVWLNTATDDDDLVCTPTSEHSATCQWRWVWP